LSLLAAVASSSPLSAQAEHHSLKLNTLYTPQLQDIGLYLKVRIDGGPALRMVLDSGSKNIVLDAAAARTLHKRRGAAVELFGFGATLRVAHMLQPGTLEMGDLVLRECEMAAVDGRLPDGIDGVIPLSLFAGFLVRLNVPGRTLKLDRYPDETPRDGSFSPVLKDSGMIYFTATVDESKHRKHDGYLLLDTGASFNAVSTSVIRMWAGFQFLSRKISLAGGAGDSEGLLLPPGLRFRFASRVVAADPAVVVDLSQLSEHHLFEVAGVVGYPALRDSVVTIDYRDSLIRIERK
jgi:hypothetical protein